MPQPQVTTAYTLHPAAAAREVAGEIFVVTDDRGLHRLEVPTAVTVFRKLMAGPTQREALIAQLVDEFEVEWEVAARDLDDFVALLVERRIAVACEQPAAAPLSSHAAQTTLSRGATPNALEASEPSPGSQPLEPRAPTAHSVAHPDTASKK